MSKISALTELAEVPATGDEVAVRDISDTGTVATGVTKRVSRSNFLGYTEYVALLTQSGANAPTAVDIKNDTGATVTWSRFTQGRYYATFSSAVLTANKTIGIIAPTSAIGLDYGCVYTSTTIMEIRTGDTGSLADGILTATPVIIRIYI